jgi:hypothetical protein
VTNWEHCRSAEPAPPMESPNVLASARVRVLPSAILQLRPPTNDHCSTFSVCSSLKISGSFVATPLELLLHDRMTSSLTVPQKWSCSVAFHDASIGMIHTAKAKAALGDQDCQGTCWVYTDILCICVCKSTPIVRQQWPYHQPYVALSRRY